MSAPDAGPPGGRAPAGEVTDLLLDWSRGDPGALEKVIPLVYAELKRMARQRLRGERSDHTLQSTALVHEAYLRLVDQRRLPWQNRAHFFAVASRAMRQVLVDHARSRTREKRGGAAERVTLEDSLLAGRPREIDLLALDEALERLERLDAPQARIVELRFFGGLTVEETAEVVSSSPRTVKREWATAKAWLGRELRAPRA